MIGVRLTGQSIGARVTLKTKTGYIQTGEITAGSGYLSQSTARLTFSIPNKDALTSITVQWPNGTKREYQEDLAKDEIFLRP